MFKFRRGSTVRPSSDLFLCEMCGRSMPVDAGSGRCALGHRVAAPVSAPDTAVVYEVTEPIPVVATQTTGPPPAEDLFAPLQEDTGTDGYGAEGLEEFLTWQEPTAAADSALHVNAGALPVAADPVPTADPSPTPPPAADLLDELEDVAHARRTALGTVGATVAATSVVFASVAALPF